MLEDNERLAGMTSSEEDSSSPFVEDAELELGLGLSLSSSSRGAAFREANLQRQHYARILTAQDLPSLLLQTPSSSSSASSTTSAANTASCSSTSSNTLGRVEGSAGTMRAAYSVAAPDGAPSQVVGWPPVRAYRMNSMVNQAKSAAMEEYNSMIEKSKSKNSVEEKITNGSNKNNCSCKVQTSPFVKVYMEGMPIGRKIDLSAPDCYETLAQTLEDMFLRPTSSIDVTRPSTLESNIMENSRRQSKLLGGSSEFVLTYEDKEGDWMLVGDVPWGMFLNSVKRLKIMRTSEATGLGKQI